MNINNYNQDVNGKVLNWFYMDSKSSYEKNLKFNRNEMSQFIDLEITYKFNSKGYRCDEFNSNDSIIFLGCSHTFGLGLKLEDTWPYIVSKHIGLENFNLSIVGGSNDSAFRIFNAYHNDLNSKIVVLLSPTDSRKELLVDNKSINYNVGYHSFENNLMWKQWLTNNINHDLNRKKNILAIENLCYKKQIKFIHFFAENFEIFDYARDLVHYGPKSNMKFAGRVIDAIK